MAVPISDRQDQARGTQPGERGGDTALDAEVARREGPLAPCEDGGQPGTGIEGGLGGIRGELGDAGGRPSAGAGRRRAGGTSAMDQPHTEEARRREFRKGKKDGA